jgi:hypothetical protein
MKTIQMMAGGTGMGGAKEMAEMLRRMGRNGDTMLAHITPEEAELLADLGGAGTSNPDTGLPEFYSDYDNFEPLDIGDFVTELRFDRLRNPPPVDTYQDFDPKKDIFKQDYSQPRQARQEVQTIRDFPLDRNFQQDPSIPETRRSVYERLTGARTGSLNRPDDLMQSSPIPRVYDAATGNRFTSEDPYSQALFNRSADTYFNNQPFTAPYGNRSLGELSPLEDFTLNRMDVDVGRGGGDGGFADQAEGGLKELEDVLNQYPRLTRAGTAGAGILAQALLFNRANRAMKRDIEETRRAAEPFRAAQAEAMGRATGAGLTPEQEQDLEIAQARARQGLGERGLQTGSAASGVLAAQQRRARSLARQEGFQEALRLANIADQYDRRALEMELQRDQQLGQLFAGIVGREVQQAQRTNAPATTTTTQQS